MEEELLKSLDLIRKFKGKEQECKVLCNQRNIIHESRDEVISNASLERRRELDFTDIKISY